MKSLSELIFWRVFNIWNHCATTSMLLGKVNSVGQNIFDKMPAQTSNTSTTTISTVVLQRHSTTIVIALLQSGIHIHLKVNYQKDFFFHLLYISHDSGIDASYCIFWGYRY